MHDFDPYDDAMHEVRNQALRRVLRSKLLIERAKEQVEQAHALTARAVRASWTAVPHEPPPRTSRRGRGLLRLVKG